MNEIRLKSFTIENRLGLWPCDLPKQNPLADTAAMVRTEIWQLLLAGGTLPIRCKHISSVLLDRY
jgi:hypothetical protein